MVLMTQKLAEQKHFYTETLDLDLVFDNDDTIGVGRGDDIFVVIREDTVDEHHHVSKHPGSAIITFKCDGDIEDYKRRLTEDNFKIKDIVQLPEHNTEFLFVEDAEANEICLDFPLEHDDE